MFDGYSGVVYSPGPAGVAVEAGKGRPPVVLYAGRRAGRVYQEATVIHRGWPSLSAYEAHKTALRRAEPSRQAMGYLIEEFLRLRGGEDNHSITIRDIGAAVGVGPTAVYHWSAGRHFPNDSGRQERLFAAIGTDRATVYGLAAIISEFQMETGIRARLHPQAIAILYSCMDK